MFHIVKTHFIACGFLILILGNLRDIAAQTADTSGDWATGVNWDTNTAPPSAINNTNVIIGAAFSMDHTGDITMSSNGNGDVDVAGVLDVTGDIIFSGNSGGHTLTVTGDLNVSSDILFGGNTNISGVAILVSGNLVISGNLELQQNAGSNIGITIQDGGVLVVEGNWLVDNSALNNLTVDSGGTLVVGGDFDTGSGSNIDNFGSVYADSYSGDGTGVLIGDGGDIVSDLDSLAAEDPTTCMISSACGAVLPVELLHFSVFNDEGNTTLNWSTASELNNDYFIIEKSIDAKIFKPVAKVGGNGNSNVKTDYFWNDLDINHVLTYYRLTQYDFDGTKEALGIRAHRSFGIQINTTSFHPNPSVAGGIINIEGGEFTQASIYSISGHLFKEQLIDSNQVVLPSDLTKGVYILKLAGPAEGVVIKRISIL